MRAGAASSEGYLPNTQEIIIAMRDSIARNTQCRSKSEFTDILRKWHDNTSEHTIRESEGPRRGQTAWVWVQVGNFRCKLNGDTNREGVHEYLKLLDSCGSELKWTAQLNDQG